MSAKTLPSNLSCIARCQFEEAAQNPSKNSRGKYCPRDWTTQKDQLQQVLGCQLQISGPHLKACRLCRMLSESTLGEAKPLGLCEEAAASDTK